MTCSRPDLHVLSFAAPYVLLAALLPTLSWAQHDRTAQLPNSSQSVSFLPAVTYQTGGTEATFVAVADFNGDGIPDLAIANSYYNNTIGILLGNGDGTFRHIKSYDAGGASPATILASDLNGDGKVDLVVLNQCHYQSCGGDAVISIFLGNGDGTFELAHGYDSGGRGLNGGLGVPEIALADVNQDGKMDIVALNCASRSASECGDGNGVVAVLLGNGDGTFQSPIISNSGGPRLGSGMAVADLNGDGLPDLVVSHSLCAFSGDCPLGQIAVMLGQGDGHFRPFVSYASGGWNATGISIADLNGDGHLDLVVGGCGSSDCWVDDGVVGVLLGNGDGTFGPVSTYSTGGRLADGVAVADLNGDGTLDVVVADVIDQSVGILLGNGDGTLADAVTYPSGGSYTYSVAIQDVNGDGQPDILVTSCSPLGDACGGTIPGIVGVLLNNTAGGH